MKNVFRLLPLVVVAALAVVSLAPVGQAQSNGVASQFLTLPIHPRVLEESGIEVGEGGHFIWNAPFENGQPPGQTRGNRPTNGVLALFAPLGPLSLAGPGSDRSHAGLFRGFILRNSDVGAAALTLDLFLSRLRESHHLGLPARGRLPASARGRGDPGRVDDVTRRRSKSTGRRHDGRTHHDPSVHDPGARSHA